MLNGVCELISFEIDTNKEQIIKFIDSLKLITITTLVADTRSCVLSSSKS